MKRSNKRMKTVGCFALLLVWQINAVGVVAQNHKPKSLPKKTAQAAESSPTVVWETLVSAIERRDLNALKTTFSKGMKDGGWASDIYFPSALLSINPARREYQVAKVESGTREASLIIRRSGVDEDFKINLIKEIDGWKFATRKEVFAALDQEIEEKRDNESNLAPEVLDAPLPSKFGAGISNGVTRGVTREAPLTIPAKPPPDKKTDASAPVNDKPVSKPEAEDDDKLSLVAKQIQNKLDLLKDKKPIVITKDFSSPTATLKTIIAAVAFFDLDVGNECFSIKYRNRFAHLPKGNAGFLVIILNSYLGQIIRQTGEIGDEQINDKTARLAVKNYSSGKWHWLEFVKEDGWKLDLEAASFFQKAELPTTNPDELFFDLLDFADRSEK